MYSLILKDILVQKKSIIWVVLYCLVLAVVFQGTDSGGMAYVMVGVASIYLFITSACAYDEKNSAEIVLNSLPLTRRNIVTAKYLGMLLFMVIVLGIIVLSVLVFTQIPLPIKLRPLTFQDVIGIIVSTGLLAALFYPTFFKVGYHKARIINLVLFFSFFFLPGILVNYLRKHQPPAALLRFIRGLAAQPDWLVAGGILLIIAVLLLLSYILSVQFYRQREF